MADFAIRIICTYKEESLEIRSTERIEMMALESDPLTGFDQQIGFWLEVRDANEKLLYRQLMPDPFRPDVEVFSAQEDQTDPISMAPREEIAGHLVFLIPETPDIDHITLVRAETEPDGETRRVVEVSKLPVSIQGEPKP